MEDEEYFFLMEEFQLIKCRGREENRKSPLGEHDAKSVGQNLKRIGIFT